MSTPWLSNTYLVLDDGRRKAVMIDAGGPVEPLLEQLERDGYELSYVLLTHHHHDHVAELDTVLASASADAGADPPARADRRSPGHRRPRCPARR